MKRVRFLSAEQIVRFHEILLERWGGQPGGGHRGAHNEGAEAAVQAVKNSYYEKLETLAAAYAVYIVQGHIFMGGNKRAAAAAMLTFLQLNRIAISIESKRLAALMIELQTRSEAGEDANHLIQWLANVIAHAKTKR